MDESTEAVAGAVRAALAERRVDVDTLAGWLGVSRSTASKKRHGRILFSLADLRIVAHELDVDGLSLYPEVVFVRRRSANPEKKASA